MISIHGTGGKKSGALAVAALALAIGMAAANCGQVPSNPPPTAPAVTKLETYVNNLTIPGAPRNTAYNGGEAEIVAHLQGTGTYVAFWISFPWGIIRVPNQTITVTTDATTGITTTDIVYSQSCAEIKFSVMCRHDDGWIYARVDFMGHARVMFGVGDAQGYWDVLTRPAVMSASGVMGPKIELEERTRVFFSTDMYNIYN